MGIFSIIKKEREREREERNIDLRKRIDHKTTYFVDKSGSIYNSLRSWDTWIKILRVL